MLEGSWCSLGAGMMHAAGTLGSVEHGASCFVLGTLHAWVLWW